MQLALFIDSHRVKLYNVASTSDEPDSLTIDTRSKQWLVTPNGAALLAIKYLPGPGWCMDVYALEQCPPQQKLFDERQSNEPLPEAVAQLPPQVGSNRYFGHACMSSIIN